MWVIYQCEWENHVQELTPSVQRGVVTAYTNCWLEDAKVRPMMLWLDDESPAIAFVYGETAEFMRALNAIWAHPEGVPDERSADSVSDNLDDDPSSISFGGGKLFGILAIQLAVAFQSANGI